MKITAVKTFICDGDDPPWRDDIMTHPLEFLDRPGFGSDLIESELEKYPYIWHKGVR